MNSNILEQLQPLEVFKYFKEICSIPHGSRNVEKISNYCVEFAKSNGLYYRQDDSFNVIIKKPATKGYEDRKPVIIQGHIDMVAVKTPECTKNLLTDGLDLDVKDGYLYAKETSLGADDGIAIAYAMAILASDTIEHPALEVIFTTDEEIGMFGASALDLSDFKSRMMLNIDSEEEGILLAGCAGGATAECVFPVKLVSDSGVKCVLKISGLTGGHSGVEIICQRANANVLLGRILNKLSKIAGFKLVSVCGGEKENAIPVSAEAVLVADKCDVESLRATVDGIAADIKEEFVTTDSDIKIELAVCEAVTAGVMEKDSSDKVIAALNALPNGILKMSNDIEGLVQTSLNLGVLETRDESVVMTYSVRSAYGSEKEELLDRLECISAMAGGSCTSSGSYPAWEYQRESHVRDVFVSVYKDLYHKEPKIQTIHAGLECGIIAGKLPNLDCISFGPEIKDIHTTKERLDIASTERTWRMILEVLKRI